jgi:pyruvate carboxylase
MLIPVFLPRFLEPNHIECECQRLKIDLEFKTVQLTWLKKPGDHVQKKDVICEVEFEKVICEINSPAEGYLEEICIKDGESCGVNEVLCYIRSLQ